MVSEWRSVIAVSLNVGGGIRLIKPAKLCMCKQHITNTTRQMNGARCVRQWFHIAEPLREHCYENWNTHKHTHTLSFCLLITVSTPPVSQCNQHYCPLTGCLNFYTFTCTGNIAMCWEPRPPAEKFYLKDIIPVYWVP